MIPKRAKSYDMRFNFLKCREAQQQFDLIKGITVTSVVCKFRPEKDDPNRTRITIMGKHCVYAGDAGTKTASLDLCKLLFNSVISQKGAKFITYDITNYYLRTPLDYPEYTKIKLTDIPQDFIDEYNLHDFIHNGWVYFEIRNGVYGLPQSGSLAQQLLEKRLPKHGYY